ncbi:MAG: hypothetical protein JO048_01195 [Methylobacteriaceae bacterium]|nr:hypothetical protein [Methylobacteriaceae bacterium]
MPTNVVDLLGRERRWCQGNLQHLRVFPMPGLTDGSRIHIAMGIGGYLLGPLWWAFVLLGAIRVLADPGADRLGVLAYGATEPGPAGAALLAFSLAILVLPRLLNVLRSLLGTRERREAGGAARLLASTVAEQIFSSLLMPLLSLVTQRFVLQTFAGRVVPWESQSRADRDVGWREAVVVLRTNLVVGLALLAAAVAGGGWYALWMTPMILGLLLGPALVVWSSRLGPGEATRRLGLFLTGDETEPAPELVELSALWRAAREPHARPDPVALPDPRPSV